MVPKRAGELQVDHCAGNLERYDITPYSCRDITYTRGKLVTHRDILYRHNNDLDAFRAGPPQILTALLPESSRIIQHTLEDKQPGLDRPQEE